MRAGVRHHVSNFAPDCARYGKEAAMAHREHRLTFQERVAIQHAAAAGQSDAAIAVALQCSRWTVRKWRRRAAQCGQVVAAPRLGRPPTGALSTLAPAL